MKQLFSVFLLFSVFAYGQDLTPPIFNGVEFSPSSAANGDVISVIVDALDDTSGIDRIQIDIRNPEGEQLTSAFSSLSNWTDLGNNRYSYDVTINEFAISGDWYVSAVYIYDIAGNKFSDSFTSTNSPYILSVTSTTPDVTPPIFNGVEFSPSSAANGDVISVIVDALDDTSGIDRIQIDIRNPEGEQLTSAFSSLSNWTDLGNNRYSYDVTINEFAISGDWYVSAVYIYDIAGNKFSDSFTSTNSPYILSVGETTSSTRDILLNGTVSAENNQIKNVADPTDSQDAATKSYVDSNVNSFSGSYNDLSDKPTSFSGSYSDLTNAPTMYTQAQVDALITNLQNQINDLKPLEDVDGNTYEFIKYGDQVWTVENAEMVTYRDGTEIPEVTDGTAWSNLTTGAWCYYDNNSTKGRLYNWYAIMGIHDAASLADATLRKAFAPEGWHVASDAEWTTLENYLIANGYNYDSTTTENKIGKAMASTAGWNSSANTGAPGNDQSLNNGSGFNAFPEGSRRSYDGAFPNESNYAFFWSSTESSADLGWYRYLSFGGSYLYRNDYDGKRSGLSVRFVRD